MRLERNIPCFCSTKEYGNVGALEPLEVKIGVRVTIAEKKLLFDSDSSAVHRTFLSHADIGVKLRYTH